MEVTNQWKMRANTCASFGAIFKLWFQKLSPKMYREGTNSIWLESICSTWIRREVMMHRPKRLDFEPGWNVRAGTWNLISLQEEKVAWEKEIWCRLSMSVPCTLTWNCSCPGKLWRGCLSAWPEKNIYRVKATFTVMDSKAKTVTAPGHGCCVKQSSGNENCFATN